jgi:hypothetical protein
VAVSSDPRDAAPPFVAKETEMMVLAACLDYEGVTALFLGDGLREQHFFSQHHRTIWRRLVEAHHEAAGHPQLAVRMLLAKHGELEEVGLGYIAKLLAEGMPRPREDTVRALTGRLVECAVGRDVLALLARTQDGARQDGPRRSLRASSRRWSTLRSLGSQLKGRLIPDHVSHVSEVMEERRRGAEVGPAGFHRHALAVAHEHARRRPGARRDGLLRRPPRIREDGRRP